MYDVNMNNDASEVAFGVDVARLDQLAAARGWGPGELAAQSGLNYNSVFRVRAERSKAVSAETVARLARALGTTIDFLLGLTDNPQPADSTPPPAGSVEIAAILREMPLEVCTEVLRVVRTIARVHALTRAGTQRQIAARLTSLDDQALLTLVQETRKRLESEPQGTWWQPDLWGEPHPTPDRLARKQEGGAA